VSHKSIIIATPHARDLNRWQEVLPDTGDLRIVAHAPGLMELFNKVEHGPPNIVLIADALCHADEFELIVTLFDALDVRWLKFTSLDAACAAQTLPENTSTGAGLFRVSLHDSDASLRGQVRALGRARQQAERPVKQTTAATGRRFKRIVLIGSSTGGVDALKAVLCKFGPDCPPTVVVQHTTKGFGEGLCRVLGRASSARVRMFEPDAPLQSGTVLIVAGLPQHVVLTNSTRPRLQFRPTPVSSSHTPSIDVLFQSGLPFASRRKLVERGHLMNSATPISSATTNITVIQGQVEISNNPRAVLSTILGSCVAVCMWDPRASVGGMNHFLLAQGGGKMDVKYGAYAMEMLVNRLLRAGAQRNALQCKLFGGAVLSGFGSNIGHKNAEFARNFIADEGITCLGESLKGNKPRRVRFAPTTGKVQLLFVQPAEVATENAAPAAAAPDITLF